MNNSGFKNIYIYGSWGILQSGSHASNSSHLGLILLGISQKWREKQVDEMPLILKSDFGQECLKK